MTKKQTDIRQNRKKCFDCNHKKSKYYKTLSTQNSNYK